MTPALHLMLIYVLSCCYTSRGVAVGSYRNLGCYKFDKVSRNYEARSYLDEPVHEKCQTICCESDTPYYGIRQVGINRVLCYCVLDLIEGDNRTGCYARCDQQPCGSTAHLYISIYNMTDICNLTLYDNDDMHTGNWSTASTTGSPENTTQPIQHTSISDTVCAGNHTCTTIKDSINCPDASTENCTTSAGGTPTEYKDTTTYQEEPESRPTDKPHTTVQSGAIGGPPSRTAGVAVAVGLCVVALAVTILVSVLLIRRRMVKGGCLYNEPRDVPLNNKGGHIQSGGIRPDSFVIQDDEISEESSTVWNTSFKVEDFACVVKKRHLEADSFKKEFKRLAYKPHKPWMDATRENLKKKNRFKDILPYDDNRVKLTILDDDPLTDYINASYMQGHKARRMFIACIGPTVDTKGDFWRMVWEQKVHVVVMVTKLVENGIVKCIQYWPEIGSEIFGLFTVKLMSENVWPEYTLRQFKIVSQDKEERTVSHFHYTTWPDKGVPADGTSLLNFRKRIIKSLVPNTPTVVHCSAGVGRTGTLISLENLLSQASEEAEIDVFACVSKLREQRVYMVQTLEQYTFIYDTLALFFTVGETTIPISQFDGWMAALEDTNDDGIPKLHMQFNAMVDLSPTIDEGDKMIALSPENKNKNRYHNILPLMNQRVLIQDPGQKLGEYINAVFVNGYQKVDAFMATQIPLPDTVDDYWRMVIDRKCATILVFGTDQEESVPNFLPTPAKTIGVTKYTVALSSDDNSDEIKIMNIVIDETEQEYVNVQNAEMTIDESKRQRIKVFKVDLTDHEILLSTSTVITLYKEVQNWQQHSGDKPVVVTCLNGATYCGQYIACHNLFSMLNLEQEVDVFQVVRQLKKSRPEFINTMDQYRNLHEAVRKYAGLFDNYANFH